jgi:hypothetical protein
MEPPNQKQILITAHMPTEPEMPEAIQAQKALCALHDS